MSKPKSNWSHGLLTKPYVPWTPHRVVEMVGLVQRGATDEEIADALGMCPRQVSARRAHLSHDVRSPSLPKEREGAR